MATAVNGYRTSLTNKLNFMKKAFVDPYFDSSEDILRMLGIVDSTSTNEGILRLNYTASVPPSAAITSADDMKRLFPDTIGSASSTVLTVADTTVMSSLKESGAVPTKEYTVYEYMGTLLVPENASYRFDVETTGQVEVYLDYKKVAEVYGATRMDTSDPVPLDAGEYPIKVRFVQQGVAGATQTLDVKWQKIVAAGETQPDAETLKCDNLYYNPADQNRSTSQSATFNESAFVDNLVDYENRFRLYFGVQNQAFTRAVKADAILTKIRVTSGASNLYEPFVCGNGVPSAIPSGDWDPATGRLNGDVNFYHYLNALKESHNGNHLKSLMDSLRSDRLMYNAMDDLVYEKIAQNPGDTSAVVEDYVIDPSTKKPITVLANTVLTSAVMETLKKVTPVERFVLRRLVLLTELVTHAHISMFIFENAYGSTVPCQNALQGVLAHFVNRLKHLNSKYDQMFESSSNVSHNDILDNLYSNIHTFDKNSKKMDVLATDFSASKLKLKSNLKGMESEKGLYSSGNKWTRVFLVVTVIVIATLIAYTVLSVSNPAYKWVGAGAVSGVAALSALIIYLVKSKTMELFTGNTYNPIAWSQAIATQSSIDVIRVAYQYDMMREVNAFIQNTIHMALILQNSKTYSYINHTIEKEINYYTATKQQVDNAKTLAKASERMYNLETRNNLSRVNVYIALIIILTFAIVGYRLSGDRKGFQYTVLGISGFLLLMVALLYIIDVERKVRTDGRKIYWGQPNDMLAKL